MQSKRWGILAVVCALAVGTAVTIPARAQEAKEKPPMYTYVTNWTLPRAQWADMEKNNNADDKVLEKAMADGTIVGYGSDLNIVHTVDGATHDNWWSAMSMAGLLNVLDHFYKSGNATVPVLSAATKHWDDIFVTTHYNWHSGSFKGAYTRGSYYKLKADAPPNAVDTLANGVFVPLLEKLLSDGAILEYEVDTEAIHTDDPGSIFVAVIAANADGLDKFNAAVKELGKTNPMTGPGFSSMVDFSAHRDELFSSVGTYK